MKKSFLGIIFIILGLGFLFQKLGFLNFSTIISTWWPLILIVIGAIQLSPKSSSKTSGYILLILGILFQVKELNIITIDISDFIWPLILIVIGISILAPKSTKKREYIFDTNEVSEDSIDNVSLFSGLDTKNSSKNFKGGSLVSLFGGIDVNLKDAVLSKNGATIHATVAFGGIDILVPDDWKVVVKGIPIFGGWSNETNNKNNISVENPILTINCFVIFGGIDIKN